MASSTVRSSMTRVSSPSASTDSSEASAPPRDLTEIQVFRPTMAEFTNFVDYIGYMESQGAHHAGITKIIPPAEWRPRVGPYNDLDNLIINRPIVQRVEGQQGVFTQYNVVHRKEITVKEYKMLARSDRYQPPVFFDLDDTERKYWRSVTLNPPIYGADTPGSLYDEDVNVWNINRLGTILDLLDTVYKKKIEGVNTAYLYFGMWKTSFCWHVEDMDLYSINYLHFGAPKFWYSIPPKHGYRLENLVAGYFPESYRNCPAFLRHKMTLISPTILRTNSIPVHKIDQRAGEFMVTFPRGYHAGFNTGYNCAESTNFATKRWIDYGKNALLCLCDEDAVRISMDAFVREYQSKDEYEEWKSRTYSSNGRESSTHHSASSGMTGRCMTMISKRHPLAAPTTSNKKAKKTRQTVEQHRDDQQLTLAEVKLEVNSDDTQADVLPSCSKTSSGLPPVKKEKVATCRGGGTTTSTKVARRRKSSDSSMDMLNDPYSLGSWAKPLENLWTFKIFDMQAERDYNRKIALSEPHCCLCQYFISRTLARNADAVPGVGMKIRRIITEMCFYKSDGNWLTANVSSSSSNGQQLVSDRLLTCRTCAVTVHASCYAGNRAAPDLATSTAPWECDRCRAGATMAECALCCLRGGAMKPTNDMEWAHMICALITPGAAYRHPATRRSIALERLSTANAAVCKFCHSNVGYPIMCSYSSCRNTYHVTCGFHAGVAFEIKDWPTVMATVCPDHNLGTNGFTKIAVNDQVYVRRSDKDTYLQGRICSSTEEIYCVVDFDDGSFSNNLYPQDIESCSCPGGDCAGSHAAGSHVQVRWTDGELYGATFLRAYRTTSYLVALAGGENVLCNRDELYSMDEPMPAADVKQNAQ